RLEAEEHDAEPSSVTYLQAVLRCRLVQQPIQITRELSDGAGRAILCLHQKCLSNVATRSSRHASELIIGIEAHDDRPDATKVVDRLFDRTGDAQCCMVALIADPQRIAVAQAGPSERLIAEQRGVCFAGR